MINFHLSGTFLLVVSFAILTELGLGPGRRPGMRGKVDWKDE